LRRAVAGWYTGKNPRAVAYQCVKYQQRNGWSHRDLLRLAHAKATGTMQDVFYWVVKGWPDVGESPHDKYELLPIWAMEKAKRATSKQEIVRLIRDHDLVRECIPTEWLNEPEVWDALLAKMPLTAMIRNLATMTRVGLLAPLSTATGKVVAELANVDRLRMARIHPIAVLAALKTYAQGHGERGKSTWNPVAKVIDALDGAFYSSFGNVQATGKRWMLALDVSGSMQGSMIAGMPGMSANLASAAMALVTAAVEPQHGIMAFQTSLKPLGISPRQRLDDAVRTAQFWEGGGTDCSQPMLYAMQQRLDVDVFAVFTDSETWAGYIHPAQALAQYRAQSGIPAKLIVVGCTATQFSIADPNDAGMLDVVGFDTATPNLMADFAVSANTIQQAGCRTDPGMVPEADDQPQAGPIWHRRWLNVLRNLGFRRSRPRETHR
jgi:60 kDa SS-A/Ro ribonucleoprotein